MSLDPVGEGTALPGGPYCYPGTIVPSDDGLSKGPDNAASSTYPSVFRDAGGTGDHLPYWHEDKHNTWRR